MPDGENNTEARAAISVVRSIHEIDPADWDACAGASNPFLSHAFLSALEDSGSVKAETGWLPQHLVYADDEDRIAGIVPLYLKGHSQGEYVFDWGWADAYERAGGEYYPKLLSAVPFTPVTGPRLLCHPDADAEAVGNILIGGLIEITKRFGVSSLHLNFLPEAQWNALGEAGFLKRVGLQFHWHNDGYQTFGDFLDALSSRKRKAIRKERKAAAESGLTIRQLTGTDIETRHWDSFYRFYTDTSDRKWGSAYLTRSFFDLLGERMADRVLLVIAEMDGTPVAGALNLIGDDTLYGRNWGCIADFKFLHFELCYYQAIDFAIERGLEWVEAGAQGQHKIQRGYMPRYTRSCHLIPSRSFNDAVGDFLRRETEQMAYEKEALENQSPFRSEG
ncbi:GNAT family N-acetyltransferase [Nisaea sp.]|uniref:GNAT family N-acetyltransferase n=1 Tax=Nisaea sp. TaxID=2024842 RepID=UPI00329A53D1